MLVSKSYKYLFTHDMCSPSAEHPLRDVCIRHELVRLSTNERPSVVRAMPADKINLCETPIGNECRRELGKNAKRTINDGCGLSWNNLVDSRDDRT